MEFIRAWTNVRDAELAVAHTMHPELIVLGVVLPGHPRRPTPGRWWQPRLRFRGGLRLVRVRKTDHQIRQHRTAGLRISKNHLTADGRPLGGLRVIDSIHPRIRPLASFYLRLP